MGKAFDELPEQIFFPLQQRISFCVLVQEELPVSAGNLPGEGRVQITQVLRDSADAREAPAPEPVEVDEVNHIAADEQVFPFEVDRDEPHLMDSADESRGPENQPGAASPGLDVSDEIVCVHPFGCYVRIHENAEDSLLTGENDGRCGEPAVLQHDGSLEGPPGPAFPEEVLDGVLETLEVVSFEKDHPAVHQARLDKGRSGAVQDRVQCGFHETGRIGRLRRDHALFRNEPGVAVAPDFAVHGSRSLEAPFAGHAHKVPEQQRGCSLQPLPAAGGNRRGEPSEHLDGELENGEKIQQGRLTARAVLEKEAVHGPPVFHLSRRVEFPGALPLMMHDLESREMPDLEPGVGGSLAEICFFQIEEISLVQEPDCIDYPSFDHHAGTDDRRNLDRTGEPGTLARICSGQKDLEQ